MMSRNDMCWCGSGKKYKKCHWQQDTELEALRLKGMEVPPKRLIKNEADIDGIRAAGQFSKYLLDMVAPMVKPGVCSDDIDAFIYELTKEKGGYPATLNYKNYPKSCCISVNNVICHGIPGDWFLQEGDIANIDVTTYFEGYYGDTSRMFAVGDVKPEAAALVRVAQECMDKGIEQVKPFNRLGDIAWAIEKYASQYGYSVVRDYGGHGIGKEFHEDPFIFHFGPRERGMVLVPNMVFTVEPMINAGGYRCKLLKDKWTSVTADGSLSAQWEHTIRVTEDGAEILTA